MSKLHLALILALALIAFPIGCASTYGDDDDSGGGDDDTADDDVGDDDVGDDDSASGDDDTGGDDDGEIILADEDFDKDQISPLWTFEEETQGAPYHDVYGLKLELWTPGQDPPYVAGTTRATRTFDNDPVPSGTISLQAHFRIRAMPAEASQSSMTIELVGSPGVSIQVGTDQIGVPYVEFNSMLGTLEVGTWYDLSLTVDASGVVLVVADGATVVLETTLPSGLDVATFTSFRIELSNDELVLGEVATSLNDLFIVEQL